MFVIWLFVAGTYGRQYFRNAGATNGAQIKLSPIAAPPVAMFKIKINNIYCAEINNFFLPDKPIRILPPVDNVRFGISTFVDP